ncbi:cysteine--tRNA ligase, partial [Testudinibacter sp. TR-2022]
RELGEVLGILYQQPEAFLQAGSDDSEVAEIEALIQQRNQARTDKNWAAADQARDKLNAMGIILEDSADGTIWRKA